MRAVHQHISWIPLPIRSLDVEVWYTISYLLLACLFRLPFPLPSSPLPFLFLPFRRTQETSHMIYRFNVRVNNRIRQHILRMTMHHCIYIRILLQYLAVYVAFRITPLCAVYRTAVGDEVFAYVRRATDYCRSWACVSASRQGEKKMLKGMGTYRAAAR